LETGSTTDFTYNVSVSGTTATVTLSGGNASTGDVEADINGATYQNNSQDPTDADRVVTITQIVDSGGQANGGDDTNDLSLVSTVDVNPVDDAIDTTTIGNTVTFTEDAGATTALFAASIDTIETGDTIIQVVLTLANIEVGDTLSFGVTDIDLNTNAATVASGFTYTVTGAGATPVVTITHTGADDATVNAMLNSAVFNNTTNNAPSTTDRTVTFTSITDSGSGITADGTVSTINVVAVNDAPSFGDENSPTTFYDHTMSTDFNGATSVFTIDLDQDGDMDVIGTALTNTRLSWF
ncbi:MAG: hypothetical protein GY698_25275, partial [Actinomycetia bacterium]|nr:hypothetical protein [Actinomycetes bacterium]